MTNDDGVFAPGIAALARGLDRAFDGEHQLMVVAPLVDHSGAGAAVGPVYERESIPFEAVQVHGLENVPVFGIEGPPALAVILACIEGFGDRPDMIVSGINHGINAGRSALHSGTVGATLTGAQFGVRGLAVSIAWGADPVPWETPVALVNEVVPELATMEPGTVLNLNVPALPLDQLRGIRHGSLGAVGLIRSARQDRSGAPVGDSIVDRTGGAVTLTLRGGRGSDRRAEQAELDPESDAGAIAAGWASLTPLVGVREDLSDPAIDAMAKALGAISPRFPGSVDG
ncbi:MAG TPA: 5'/3'-nucleotidase SurE [Acidimicrobiales bacterium]|nr:5'/3'-nucleotidase SurE [Acidimicrobiales bacterium]